MIKYLGSIVVCLLLTSCASGGPWADHTGIEPAYHPNKMHMPFFSKSAQVQLEASVSEWFQLAGGYSVSDNIAIVSSLRFMNPGESDSDFHQNRFFDLGAGYFISDRSLRLEGYIRIGKGYSNVSDQYDRHYYVTGDTGFSLGLFSYDYMKYSLQINAGLEWVHWLVGLSLRGGYMHLQNVRRAVRTPPGSPVTLYNYADSEGSANIDFAISARYKPIPELAFELQGVMGQMTRIIGFDDARSPGSSAHAIGVLSVILKF